MFLALQQASPRLGRIIYPFIRAFHEHCHMVDRSSHKLNPSALYLQRVSDGELIFDVHQEALAGHLDSHHHHLSNMRNKGETVLHGSLPSWRRRYALDYLSLVIAPGTGKTMMMDLLHDTLPGPRVMRTHFNQFMNSVHSRIFHFSSQSNYKGHALSKVTDEISSKYSVMCFDEFQVLDIADACIMSDLFSRLIDKGMSLVATSNRSPSTLYENGIQRELFLPFIDLINETCEVIDINSHRDYRSLLADCPDCLPCYSIPINNMKDDCEEVASAAFGEKGRTLNIQSSPAGVAVVHFDDLCRKPLGSADYLQISRNFPLIFLPAVPTLATSDRETLRRFIVFVDSMYEMNACLLTQTQSESVAELFQKGKAEILSLDRATYDDLTQLGASSDSAKSGLFSAAEEEFAWARTVSRLHEMKTPLYWREAGLDPVATKQAIYNLRE